MRYMILGAAMLFLVFNKTDLQAQNEGDNAEIKKVIATLFKGMELGDSAMVHAVFTPQAGGASVFRDKDDNPLLRNEDSFRDFFKAIGTPHKETWFEEIWDLTLQVDGDLAQAWCQYAFYLDKRFSHCGVDAFYLHKEKAGWKIFYLVDTRRKQNCAIPEAISAKHK